MTVRSDAPASTPTSDADPTAAARGARALQLDAESRARLWSAVAATCEAYAVGVDAMPVAPPADPGAVRALLAGVDFARPMSPQGALALAAEGLWHHSLHVAHPRYFGLFNPTPTTMGIAADAMVAAFNPQLAAWGHSPFGVEVERHLVRAFGARLGFPADAVDGTFTTGGQEANHTAMIAALARAFPAWRDEGVRALPGAPALYASSEAHHSLEKAARACGLGDAAVRRVDTDAACSLDAGALRRAIAADRDAGRAPFLVVATAGTTSAGIVDPLEAVADVARDEGVWLHVDAAWGGAAALVPELRPVLAGIERADSLTLDCHKWLSVPMGAGLLLTRHSDALDRAFRVSPAYVPRDAAEHDVVDPYAHTLQWSRRFIGLKVFLSLAVAGWDGYAAALRHQVAMGDLLRDELAGAGWRVVNRTPLPVVCFVDAFATGAPFVEAVARAVTDAGRAWVSTTRLGTRPVLRACVTSFRTTAVDVRALVRELGVARAAASDGRYVG